MAGCRMFWRQACYVPGAPGCTDDQNSLSTFPKPPWCTAPSGWDPPAGGCHTNRLHSAGTARHANRRTGVGRSVCLSVRQSVPSLPECLCQVSCFNPPRPRPSPLLPVALEENHPTIIQTHLSDRDPRRLSLWPEKPKFWRSQMKEVPFPVRCSSLIFTKQIKKRKKGQERKKKKSLRPQLPVRPGPVLSSFFCSRYPCTSK